MPDTNEDKMKRAAELDAAIKAHDAKRKDGEIDLGTERASGGNGGVQLDKMLATLDACAKAMDSMSSRLDALESRHKDDKHRDERRKRRRIRKENA